MPDFTNLTVRRNPLRMEVDKQGQKLTVNQLSDGEKCLMAMVGDLARRFAIANPYAGQPPGRPRRCADRRDRSASSSEVAAHGRAEIVGGVPELPVSDFHAFPARHHACPAGESVPAAAQRRCTFCSRPAESYGKTVERVLEDLMGIETTRPDEVKSSLRHIFELIDQRDFDDARVVDRAARRGDRSKTPS